MAPTIETLPVRYFHIQLKASTTGQWAPVITVQADTVSESVTKTDARGYENVFHLFKRGETIVATIESDTIAGWWIHEDTPK